LGATLRVFGPSPFAAIALAALCFAATGWLTWSIARELLGRREATAVMLLWSLQQSFSVRAQLYNHNTALVLFIAATAWAALRVRRHPGWWVIVGTFAGAALLCKYQAALPLAGILFALAWSGALKTRIQRAGLATAALIAGAAFAPHVAWVVQHDLSTLRYAGQSVQSGEVGGRFISLARFLANQVRMLFPALAAVALVAGWSRLARGRGRAAAFADSGSAVEAASRDRPEARAWVMGLVGLPLGILVICNLLGGVSLRNHWGVQTFQFVALALVYLGRGLLARQVRRLAVVMLDLQAIGLGLYVQQHAHGRAYEAERRHDSAFPGQRLADAALANWRRVTSCPLRYVAGDSFTAGLVSLHTGGTAAVYEGALQSPWIDAEDLKRSGAILVLQPAEVLPPGLVSPIAFPLAVDSASDLSQSLTLAVKAPEVDCGAKRPRP
jgi:hypothetical protein